MRHAYNEYNLSFAMDTLGEAVDYAVNVCNFSVDSFFQLFITTKISDQFGSGVPKVISGISGIELVLDVLSESGYAISHLPEPKPEYYCTKEYWTGWIIAYYQWYLGRSFKTIFDYISPSEIEAHYSTLHEASEKKCVDVFNQIIRNKKLPSRLQTRRKQCLFSQRELSVRSGVKFRTLQQYESKAKDINKAASYIVLELSKALYCNIEDLLELELVDIE